MENGEELFGSDLQAEKGISQGKKILDGKRIITRKRNKTVKC